MDIEGKLFRIMPPQTGTSQKGAWVKQDIIIEQTSDFGKKLCVSVWGDKTKELSQMAVGDAISVGVNIESKEYNNRWYTELRAWKISPLNSQQTAQLSPMENLQEQYPSVEDDMPF